MTRFLIAMVAREGQEGALEARIVDEVRGLRSETAGINSRIHAMIRVPNDPFAAQYPVPRAFDAVIDIEESWNVAPFDGWVRGLAGSFGDTVHLDLSAIVTGDSRRIGGSSGGPTRFLYFMRRKAGSSHDFFSQYWGERHAEFGKKMPGTLGYEQLHADPDASRALSADAGFGTWAMDGVAILHLESVATFVAAAATSDVGADAIKDEREFVDGRNSVGLAMEIIEENV